jgi:hypothetical protein
MTRARVGVPSASLDRAARLDFTILWEHLLELCGPRDAPLLATRVELVWRIVDEYVGAITSSYEQETVRLARSERVYLRDFLSRLFSRSGRSPETVASVANALRVDAAAPFTVIAVTDEHEPQLRSLLSGRRSGKVFEYDKDGLVYVFWPVDLRDGEVPDISALVCGIVDHVDGLGTVPEASTTAGSLARIASPEDGGPVSAERGWTRLVRGLVDDAGLAFVDDVDRALTVLREAERERIEETVRSFLGCGSVNVTAQRLFCHRNTILNRLNRFEELTGIDLMVPTQSARLVLGWV